MRNPKMEMGWRGAGYARVTDKTKDLPCAHPGSRNDPLHDGRQVRSVVTYAVLSDDGNRQTTTRCGVILFRVPPVLERHEVHDAARDRDKLRSFPGKNIRGRVTMTGCSFCKINPG